MKCERRKIWKALLFAVLFVAFATVGCASAATHYVSPGESIQAAMDAADPGDTIIVRDGTYTENVDVNKSLTIQSENGSDSTIVHAANPDDHVFDVTADWVNISGFMVKGGATSYDIAGIYLEADYCNISNNNCSNNEFGIWLDDSSNNKISNNNCGIFLRYSSNNKISSNNCSNNYCGIGLMYSSNNKISNNTCSNNNWDGIFLKYSSNNKLASNTMVNNGIYISGHLLDHYMHEIDTSNKVNGKPVYYWRNVKGGGVPEGAGQVILVDCSDVIIENQELRNASISIQVAFSSNITIKNNNCSNNWDGIRLWKSSNSKISNNTCSNNYDGIFLKYSSNNKISNNTCSNNVNGICLLDSSNNKISNNICSNNKDDGICLGDSSNNKISNNTCSNNWDYGIYPSHSNNNKIYLNNFINNRVNVFSYDSTNIWNSTEKITYTYQGETYTNYLGNYWDNYTGSDSNGDGIGDTTYWIDFEVDSYPLMEPWENYFAPTENIFDTEAPANPYPSIMGTHNGTITPSHHINVSKLYTYTCVGTGGHTESIELYDENDTLIANGSWNGYIGDYHNLTIHNRTGEAPYVTLLKNHEYRYVIKTGSYPQIIHEPSKDVTGGTITCTSFVDANGKIYTDWILAIRLWAG